MSTHQYRGFSCQPRRVFQTARGHISQDLTGAVHCDVVIKKVNGRLYAIRALKKSGVATEDLVLVYCSLIRSVVEYACAAFANLPRYLANALEKVQKRALAIILPGISYEPALSATGLTNLEECRAALCARFIQRVDKTSPLYSLTRDQHCQTTCQYNLRAVVPKIKRSNTDRLNQFVTVKYGHHLM